MTRSEIQDLVITIPPRTSKSLCVAVFWPTWSWTFAPRTRWLCNSYAQSLSVRDALRSRRLIESGWYQERWRHVFALSGDQNVKSRYDNTRGGYRLAASVSGSTTGEGGDFLIADDCTNVLEGESALVREMTSRWWFEVMPSRRNDPKTSARLIIQQRVHEQDMVGEVLRQGGFHHLNLPMEYEPSVLTDGCGLLHDRRSTAGELLWSERYGETEVPSSSASWAHTPGVVSTSNHRRRALVRSSIRAVSGHFPQTGSAATYRRSSTGIWPSVKRPWPITPRP